MTLRILFVAVALLLPVHLAMAPPAMSSAAGHDAAVESVAADAAAAHMATVRSRCAQTSGAQNSGAPCPTDLAALPGVATGATTETGLRWRTDVASPQESAARDAPLRPPIALS